VKICRVTPNFDKIGRKYRALYMKTEVGFIVVAGDIKFPVKWYQAVEIAEEV
jgi:hypothetical protein